MPLRLFPSVFPPSQARRPLQQLGSAIQLRCRVEDGNGVLVAATGGRVDIRRPDGLVITRQGNEVTSPGAGEFRAAIQADLAGEWSYEWVFTGPSEAHAVGYFQVQGSPVLPPGPGQPIIVTNDLNPVDTEDGGRLYARRVSGLPRVTQAQQGDLVYGVRGTASHAIELAALQSAVNAGAAALHFPTLTAAIAVAAAGGIPDSVETLWVAGHTTPRDGGAAPYAWVAANPGHALAFPSAGPRGGWYEIDAPALTWEMAGGFGVPIGPTPTTSMRAAVDRLVVYGWVKGGMVIRSGVRRYRIGGGTPVDWPPGTRIVGTIPAGIAQFDPDNNVLVDWARAPAIYTDQGVTFGLSGACELEELVLLHASQAGVAISTPAQQLEYQRLLRTRGTAIHIGRTRPAPDAAVRGCIIVGYDTAIESERAEWAVIEGNKIDANYGIKVTRNGTPSHILRNFPQTFADTRVETEVTNATFAAGALVNVGGNARLMLPAPGIPWLMGGTITSENVVRLRDLLAGTTQARDALAGVRNVARVSATEFDLVGEVIEGATPRTEAPIAWVTGMEAVSGRLEVKTGLKQFFRPIASIAAAPGGGARVTLGVPMPPFGLAQIYLAPMRLAGGTQALRDSFKRWYLATRVSDSVWDLPLTWAPEMAALTGELHAYCNSRLGDVEGGSPARGIWLARPDVDGPRIEGNNTKGALIGYDTAADFPVFHSNKWEAGRAGADTEPLPQTAGLVARNDIQAALTQHKGAEWNVVADNPSRELVELHGVHLRSSGGILRAKQGEVQIFGGRNGSGAGPGNRSWIDIWTDTVRRVFALGGQYSNVDIVDTSGGSVHWRKRWAFIGPQPDYEGEDTAGVVVVGADYEFFSENWPRDVDWVPTIGTRFRPRRSDGTNALTEGQEVGHLDVRTYTGAGAGTERIPARITGLMRTIGASATSEALVKILVDGLQAIVGRFTRDGLRTTVPGPFADDAAATAAGLAAGQLYRTATGLRWLGAEVEAGMLAKAEAVTWGNGASLSSWKWFGTDAPSGLDLPATMTGVFLELVTAQDTLGGSQMPSSPNVATLKPVADFGGNNGRYTLGAGKRWVFAPDALRGQGWLAVRSVDANGAAINQAAARTATWHWVGV